MLPVVKMRSSLLPKHWRSCTCVSVLVLLTLLSSVCLTEQKIASVYKNDDGNFQKLVLQEETRAMFLGAQNRLYRLSLDLAWQQEVSLGPAMDSHQCLNPDECMYERTLRDEQVKLLLASPEGEELLMCGNLYQGSCAKVAARNMTQLTWAYELVVGVASDAVFSLTAAVVTKDNELFVANSVNTRTSNHNENPLHATRPKTPFLATRNYSTLGIRYRTGYVSSQMNIDPSTKFRAIHRFAFTYVDSAYFLVTRESDRNSAEVATFIGRTCQTDPAYRSYVEARLSCNIDGIPLNFIEDAYVGTPGRRLATALRIPDTEELLFVTFSELQKSKWDRGRHSGLCVYRLADIHRKLTKSIQMCFRGQGSIGPYHLTHPLPCNIANFSIQDDYCGGSNINFPIASNEVMAPVLSRAFPNTLLSAVTVSTVGPYTVVYLGTHSGNLLKVELDSASNNTLYESIAIQPGNAILPDMLLSSDGASLYVMTSSMVVRMQVQDCGSHMTCETCMTSADPHCGWCSASKRCTAEDACQAGVLGWSRTRTGRCPAIISVQSYLTHAGTPRKVEIQNHQNLWLELSFILAIVAIAIISIVFFLTVVATAIVFIPFILIVCLCRRCQQKRKESDKEVAIPLTRFSTQNEESRGVTAGIMPPSVQMDAVMSELQSLLNGIRDPNLQERVKGAFIPSSDLELGNEIGRGEFGRIYVGNYWKQSPDTEGPMKVAVKTIRGRNMVRKKLESFLKEGMIMKTFNHPHVLSLIGVSVDNQTNIPRIILPYMSAGDLHKFISNREKHFEVPELLQFGQQVAEGMAYLAEYGFIHRDLATRNCVMDENLQVKVADFGLSKDLYKKQYYREKRGSKLPIKWMSPESLKENLFTTKSDVWSFGVLLWELMTRGVIPYPDVSSFDMREYLTSGRRLRRPDDCPEDVYLLMNECWRIDPDARPIFADLVNKLESILRPPQRNGSDESLYANGQYPPSHTEMITNDAAILQSLLNEVSDPKLREKVQDVFIPRSHLKLGDIVGTGQFGCVYAGRLQPPVEENEKVAVKSLHGQTLDHEAVESFLKEGLMMKNLDHPHVLHLLGVSMLDQDMNPLIILPFMAKGDLHSYVRNKKNRFTWGQLSQLGQQVAEGMAYLEQCRLVHRDLAARNCMMDDKLQVKVGDFGLSKNLYEKQYYRQNRECKLPLQWMALESLKEVIFTTKSDVWSFGVLLWELMTRGVMPYKDVHNFDLLDYLSSGLRLTQPENCPQDVYSLMSECWQKNPNDRPTFADIVNRLGLILHKSPHDMNSRLSVFQNRMSQNLRKCSEKVWPPPTTTSIVTTPMTTSTTVPRPTRVAPAPPSMPAHNPALTRPQHMPETAVPQNKFITPINNTRSAKKPAKRMDSCTN